MTVAFANAMLLVAFFFSQKFKAVKNAPIFFALGALLQLIMLIIVKINIDKCFKLSSSFDVISIIISIVLFLIFCGLGYYVQSPRGFDAIPVVIRNYSDRALLLPKQPVKQQTLQPTTLGRGGRLQFQSALPPEIIRNRSDSTASIFYDAIEDVSRAPNYDLYEPATTASYVSTDFGYNP
jgi:hypothetical protein